jgi:hypothetical protein
MCTGLNKRDATLSLFIRVISQDRMCQKCLAPCNRISRPSYLGITGEKRCRIQAETMRFRGDPSLLVKDGSVPRRDRRGSTRWLTSIRSAYAILRKPLRASVRRHRSRLIRGCLGRSEPLRTEVFGIWTCRSVPPVGCGTLERDLRGLHQMNLRDSCRDTRSNRWLGT